MRFGGAGGGIFTKPETGGVGTESKNDLPKKASQEPRSVVAVDGNGMTPEAANDFIGPALHRRVNLNGIEPTETASESIVRRDPAF